MGRLSSYAKNRILKLRFKKNKRIIHIVDILKKDDNIKVSRQAVSTFLKKYLETNSIYDKPRTGRKRKLTQEEIQLIGQVTRLNRDITARAIKEYLNLNVSTYTILRATKLFEWNKVNPNSNEQKKAAALERQLNGETAGNATANGKRRRSNSTGSHKKSKRNQSATSVVSTTTENEELNESSSILKMNETDQLNQTADEEKINKEKETINNRNNSNASINETENNETSENLNESENKDNIDASSTADITEIERIQEKLLNCNNADQKSDQSKTAGNTTSTVKKPHKNANSIPDFEKVDLSLIPHKELAILKNLSCSPMSFATKILFKIFKIEELHGHNVSGKTLNKNLKAKLPLDPIRIGYIKFLVEKYYDEKECKEMLSGANTHKQDLWKSCHTAINKSILISERKAACGKPPLPNSDLTGDFSNSNLDESNQKLSEEEEEEEMEEDDKIQKSKIPKKSNAGKQQNKKSKYDFSSGDEEDDSSSDSEIVIPKKYLIKKTNNHRLPIKQNERNKRFNSSSSSSEFDDSLISEDIESENEHSNSENDDVQENERKGLKKVTNLLKGKLKEEEESTKNGNRRRSQRQRRPTYKNVDYSQENIDTDDDEGVKYNDEDDQEIELIQNIESRLTSSTNTTKPNSPPIVSSSSSSLKLPVIKSNPIQSVTKAKDDSEETAAANIAAAMKKRFVVVQPSNLINNNEGNASPSSSSSQTTALKSPNLNQTPKEIKEQKSTPLSKKETPTSAIRQQPRRGRQPSTTSLTASTSKAKPNEDSKKTTNNNNNNNSIVQKSKKESNESNTSTPNNNSNVERRTTRSSARK